MIDTPDNQTEPIDSTNQSMPQELTPRYFDLTNFDLEDLLGKTFFFNPSKFGSHLYSSQREQVSMESVDRVGRGIGQKDPIQVLVSVDAKNKLEITVFDGHHRTANASINGTCLFAKVIGTFREVDSDVEGVRRSPFSNLLREYKLLFGRTDEP